MFILLKFYYAIFLPEFLKKKKNKKPRIFWLMEFFKGVAFSTICRERIIKN